MASFAVVVMAGGCRHDAVLEAVHPGPVAADRLAVAVVDQGHSGPGPTGSSQVSGVGWLMGTLPPLILVGSSGQAHAVLAVLQRLAAYRVVGLIDSYLPKGILSRDL